MAEAPQKQLDKSFSLTQGEHAKEWGAAPPPDDKKPVDLNTPKCGACGRHHVDVGITHERAEMNCLRATVIRQRQEIASLKQEMEGLRTRVRLERAGREHEPAPAEERAVDDAQPETESTPATTVDSTGAEVEPAESPPSGESRADYLARRANGASA